MKIALLTFVLGVCGIALAVVPTPQKYGVYGTMNGVVGKYLNYQLILKGLNNNFGFFYS